MSTSVLSILLVLLPTYLYIFYFIFLYRCEFSSALREIINASNCVLPSTCFAFIIIIFIIFFIHLFITFMFIISFIFPDRFLLCLWIYLWFNAKILGHTACNFDIYSFYLHVFIVFHTVFVHHLRKLYLFVFVVCK